VGWGVGLGGCVGRGGAASRVTQNGGRKGEIRTNRKEKSLDFLLSRGAAVLRGKRGERGKPENSP